MRPGCCLRRVISASRSSPSTRVPGQSACSSVRDTTSFGRAFIRVATSGFSAAAAGSGQYAAITSYVRRPNSSVSASSSCSAENAKNSGSTTGQSNSPSGPW